MHKSEAFKPSRALQASWDLLMKAPLPMWVGGLVLVAVEYTGGFMGGGPDFQFHRGDGVNQVIWQIIPMVMMGFMFTVVIMAATAFLKVGYYKGIETVMRRGDVEFEDLYKGKDRWLGVFLTLVVQAVLSFLISIPLVLCALVSVAVADVIDFNEGATVALVILSMLAYVPVLIYLFLGIALMPYPAALDGRGPLESMTIAWNLASGVRFPLFLMSLLHLAMVLAGLAACCIGILPAGIIGEVMFCEAYIQATRDDTESWGGDDRAKLPNSPADGGPGVEPAPEGPVSSEGPGAESVAAASHERELSDDEPDSGHEEVPEASPEEGGEGKPFDPGAWRQDPGIPPLDK